jgi:hypothetical protein
MTAKFLNPKMKSLLEEFFEERNIRENNEETRQKWASRDDLAEAFRPFFYFTPFDEIFEGFNEEILDVFPDALFWELALFRTAARRAVLRVRKEEEEREMNSMKQNSMFGKF